MWNKNQFGTSSIVNDLLLNLYQFVLFVQDMYGHVLALGTKFCKCLLYHNFWEYNISILYVDIRFLLYKASEGPSLLCNVISAISTQTSLSVQYFVDFSMLCCAIELCINKPEDHFLDLVGIEIYKRRNCILLCSTALLLWLLICHFKGLQNLLYRNNSCIPFKYSHAYSATPFFMMSDSLGPGVTKSYCVICIKKPVGSDGFELYQLSNLLPTADFEMRFCS